MLRRKVFGLLFVTLVVSAVPAVAANKRRLGADVSIRTLSTQTHVEPIKLRVPARYLKRGGTGSVMTRTGVRNKTSGAAMKWGPWIESGVGHPSLEVGLIFSHPTKLQRLEQIWMLEIRPVVRFPSGTKIRGTTHIFDMLTHK